MTAGQCWTTPELCGHVFYKGWRAVRAQRAKMLCDVARAWEGRSDGRDTNYAARLRAEARTLAKDPDFADMPKQAARYADVTAETEALHDRQSAKAKKRRPRPWHAAADLILDELRGKHPRWRRSALRRELKKRFEKSGPELPARTR